MKKVFVINIKPEEYSKGIVLAFSNCPSKGDVIGELRRISDKSKNDIFKTLCNRCIEGIEHYGVPCIIEESGYTSWNDKGMYSTKGKTYIKSFNVIQN
jgi:hypothetical protein